MGYPAPATDSGVLRPLKSADHGRENHFNLIPILAALGVLVSHSFALTGYPEVLIGGKTFGFLCVAIFFSISGFLITKSWLRSPVIINFTRHRCLRIYPGLWLAVAFTALIIGPLATTLPPAAYFTSFRFWAYLAGSGSLLQVVHRLPGVFDELVNHSANGSLWTLPYELICYAAILAFGLLARKNPRRFLYLIVATLAVLLAVAFLASPPANERLLPIPLVMERLAGLLPYFFFGALASYAPGRCRKIAPVLLLGMSLAIAAGRPGIISLVLPATLAPMVITLAYLPNSLLQRYNQIGDYSYGIYLYAFPIQQMVALNVPDCRPWQNVFYTLPLVLGMAFLSWHLVEKRALRFARKQPRSPR